MSAISYFFPVVHYIPTMEKKISRAKTEHAADLGGALFGDSILNIRSTELMTADEVTALLDDENRKTLTQDRHQNVIHPQSEKAPSMPRSIGRDRGSKRKRDRNTEFALHEDLCDAQTPTKVFTCLGA